MALVGVRFCAFLDTINALDGNKGNVMSIIGSLLPAEASWEADASGRLGPAMVKIESKELLAFYTLPKIILL